MFLLLLKAIISMFIMIVNEQFTCFEDVHSGILSITMKFNGICQFR